MTSVSYEAASQELVEWLRQHLRPALIMGVGVAVIAVAVSFAVPKQYTAHSSFSVASDRGLGNMNRLAGFAAQFGLAPSLSSAESPDYFAQVASIREVKLTMLQDTVCNLGQPCRTLGEALYGAVPPLTDRLEWEKRLKRLSKRMTVEVSPKTGIISVSATGRTPEEAETILVAQLKALSTFTLKTRESQARNERIFAEQRLEELQRKRKSVVAELTEFYEANRSLGLSPTLKFRERDLLDQLAQWQELVQSVARQGEAARLDEARDIPAITIIEHPYASPVKTAPRRLLWAVVGLVVGGLIGLRPDQLLRRRHTET